MLNIKEMLFGLPRQLASTGRYSTISVLKEEKVDSHTFHTAFYATLIANEIESKFFGDEGLNSMKIDWKTLMMCVLNHDIDEPVMGDLMRHVKRSNPELHRMWNIECEKAVKSVSKKLVGDNTIFEYWKEDKNPQTIEGNIIAIADVLSVVSYIYEEYQLGNRKVTEILFNAAEYLVSFNSLMLSNIFNGVFIDFIESLYKVVYELLCEVSVGYKLREEVEQFKTDRIKNDTDVLRFYHKINNN